MKKSLIIFLLLILIIIYIKYIYKKFTQENCDDIKNYSDNNVQKKELENDIKFYDEIIKNNPNDFEAFNNRGITKDYLEDFEGAIKDYDQAVKLNPNFSDAFNNRGFAKESLGWYEEVLADYNMAIKLNPKNKTAKYNKKRVEQIIAEQKKS
ncbi:MAG: tetratricopeptide repeat protein [Fusobacteriaceae bacterium]